MNDNEQGIFKSPEEAKAAQEFEGGAKTIKEEGEILPAAITVEQRAEHLLDSLTAQLAELQKAYHKEDGTLDIMGTKNWLMRQTFGLPSWSTGSDRNYFLLSDGVSTIEREVENLPDDSPIRQRAKDVIDQAKSILEIYADDPDVLKAKKEGLKWNEGSSSFFVPKV